MVDLALLLPNTKLLPVDAMVSVEVFSVSLRIPVHPEIREGPAMDSVVDEGAEAEVELLLGR